MVRVAGCSIILAVLAMLATIVTLTTSAILIAASICTIAVKNIGRVSTCKLRAGNESCATDSGCVCEADEISCANPDRALGRTTVQDSQKRGLGIYGDY